MELIRIEIDLNARTPEGYVPARYHGDITNINVGDSIIAFESEDQVQARAVVVEVDQERKLVYLDVDWSIMNDRELTWEDGPDWTDEEWLHVFGKFDPEDLIPEIQDYVKQRREDNSKRVEEL